MCALVPSTVVACSDDQAGNNTDPQFVGTWTTGCTDASTSDPRRLGLMLTMEFTLTQYTGTLAYYLDGACAQPMYIEHETGAYRVGGPAPMIAGAIEVDYHQASHTVRAFGGYATTNGYCSTGPFPDGVDVDLAGELCEGYPVPRDGDVLLGLLAPVATPPAIRIPPRGDRWSMFGGATRSPGVVTTLRRGP